MAHSGRLCLPGSVFIASINITFIGSKEKNKLVKQRQHAGRGTVGKTAVVGIKDRKTVPLTNVCKESKSSPRLNCVESATPP